jgi:hypothetical protein
VTKSGKTLQNLKSGKIVGWRETVGLPDLNIALLRAKIDSGARTSALHAEHQERFEREGVEWVRFRFPSARRTQDRILEAPIFDEREIKNTGGTPERRIIIRTTLLLGVHRTRIDVSLADRKNMEFDLILGRTAIRELRLLIHPGRSFLLGEPRQKAKKTISAST